MDIYFKGLVGKRFEELVGRPTREQPSQPHTGITSHNIYYVKLNILK